VRLGVVLGRGNGAANAFKLFPGMIFFDTVSLPRELVLEFGVRIEFFLHGRSSIGEDTIVTFRIDGDRAADTGTCPCAGDLEIGEEVIPSPVPK
jgi:hypothetical protein